MGKLLASHRYNRLPLLPSGPGGVQQELVVQDLPDANVIQFTLHLNTILNFHKKNIYLCSKTNAL